MITGHLTGEPEAVAGGRGQLGPRGAGAKPEVQKDGPPTLLGSCGVLVEGALRQEQAQGRRAPRSKHPAGGASWLGMKDAGGMAARQAGGLDRGRKNIHSLIHSTNLH